MPLLNSYMWPSQNLHIPPRIDTPPPYMWQSHKLPLPPRIYPVLYKVTLPESTSSFQNIPPFSTTMYDARRIYPPPLQEYIPLSQNIGLPPPLRYATLPESAHSSKIYPLLRHYAHSHNLPLPPIIYPPFKHLYATLTESTLKTKI